VCWQHTCHNNTFSVFPLPTRLLAIIGSFSYIYISQGSVATKLTCGGIFTNHFIANFPASVPVKKLKNRLIIGKDMDNTKCDVFGGNCVDSRHWSITFWPITIKLELNNILAITITANYCQANYNYNMINYNYNYNYVYFISVWLRN